MNRYFKGSGALAVALMFAVALGFSAISGTKHDLSSGGGLTDAATTEDQVCVFCHTPHGSSATDPLWNHTQSSVATYTAYASTTLDASISPWGGASANVSALCMSCHDGTVAVNSQINPTDPNGNDPAMGSGNELDPNAHIAAGRVTNLGSDLSNDHPVNFTYDAALATADGELVTPNDPNNYVDAAQNFPLFGGTMQCATCHDAHDDTNGQFLVIANASSALCTTCHQK